VKIGFLFIREEANLHAIKALFTNKTPQLITQVNLLVAVQKYMKLQILPASGTDLHPLA
jgi:hypothetical protein